MARILKRPMFNKGGSTNNGIMTGLVDRKGYAEGPTQAEIYAKEYEDMLSKIDPPKAKLPLGQIGLNLISGQYAGDGLLQNIAGSAKDPYASFVKQDDALRNLGYQKRMTAAKMGISRAEAERLAKLAKENAMKRQKEENSVNDDIAKAEAVAKRASDEEAEALAKAKADAAARKAKEEEDKARRAAESAAKAK